MSFKEVIYVNVLFVCSGNTCRSPMAEGIFRKYLKEREIKNISCDSAGINARALDDAAKNAVEACHEIDIDISDKKAQVFAPRHVALYDAYFTMSDTHAYILQKCGVDVHKIFVPKHISDPFGKDLQTYRECRDELLVVVKDFLEQLLLVVSDYDN